MSDDKKFEEMGFCDRVIFVCKQLMVIIVLGYITFLLLYVWGSWTWQVVVDFFK